MGRSRLVVLALDAADSRMVRKWAGEGCLPTMARLLTANAVLSIDTPAGVLEGAIWPTLYTSTSPATHGMYAYLQITPGTYDMRLGLRADRLPFPPFWDFLSRAGLRVAVIDAPLTRPLGNLNGIQVVNWGAHDGAWSWKRSSRPRGLIDEVLTRFGEHPAPATCDSPNYSVRTDFDFEELRKSLFLGIEKKAALLSHFLKTGEWDFFFGVFSESHCLGHQFWHFMDSRHPRYNSKATESLKSSIKDGYTAIDSALGTLLENRSSDTQTMILLSHGMGPYFHGTHLLDEILERLDINGPQPTHVISSHGVRKSIWELKKIVPKTVRHGLNSGISGRLFNSLWHWSHPAFNPWSQMRAFQVPANAMTGAIRVNLEGRDPNGKVKQGREYRSLLDRLSEALMELENPETGKNAVEWVAEAGELFQGPRLSELPDLFVEWDHNTAIRSLRSARIGTVTEGSPRTQRTGSHWAGGLLLGAGAQFKKPVLDGPARVVDIAPTILNFFGVPRPAFYEGQSLFEARS